jgi:hypothetical protein
MGVHVPPRVSYAAAKVAAAEAGWRRARDGLFWREGSGRGEKQLTRGRSGTRRGGSNGSEQLRVGARGQVEGRQGYRWVCQLALW